ncbi:MAG: hypothetical protein HKN07_04435 [Acidimicrobiia bacterium]|nr:hypothetical protein [Acidimicrobiia bacterium]
MKKRPAILLLALGLLVATLVGGAASAEDFAVGADYTAKTQVRDSVAALIPTGDSKADEKLEKAIEKLEEGLDLELWSEDYEVINSKAFDKDRKAVKELVKAIEELGGAAPSDDIALILDDLLAINGAIAANYIEAATAAGGDSEKIAKANEKMAKAAEKVAGDELEDAVDEYRRAWEEGEKAFDKIEDASALSGDWSEYTFYFVNLETGEETGPLTGTSREDDPLGYTGKNEGYLMVGDTLMQLHVSCSDAFVDGIGEKSDPAADSPWRVDSYTIDKYKKGEFSKSCDYVNTGTVTPPPPPPSGTPTTPGTATTDPVYTSGAKWSQYTFWFVNTETGETTGGLFGTSHPDDSVGYTGNSNEGLLIVGDTLMQLHVSCSDVFLDGVGQKSDPTADSPWRVDRYEIAKFKEGELHSTCSYVGMPRPSITVDGTYTTDGTPMTGEPGSGETVDSGDPVTFTLTVTNDGNVDLTDVTVTNDVFGAEFATGSDCAADALAAGATLVCVVTDVTVPDGPHTNTTTVTGTYEGTTESATEVLEFTVESGTVIVPPPG